MLKGIITGQKLTLKDIPLIVSDSIDYLEAVFAFRSKDWEECEKWAHFSQGDVVYDIKLTENRIRKEDHLNLGAGSWKIYLHGTSKTGMRITTDQVSFGVKKSGVLNGQPLPEIPLSVAENLDLRLSFLEEVGGYPSGVSPYIISEAKGENILVTDSAKAKLRGLVMYGKSTQNGTPTPENPVEIVSAGADGEIVVTIDGETPQILTVLTPNGLHADDYIDFARGVRVQRRVEEKVGVATRVSTTATGMVFVVCNSVPALLDNGRTADVSSNRFEGANYTYGDSGSECITIINNAIRFYLSPERGVSTLEGVNALMQEWEDEGKPLTIEYVLAEPIETPLSAEELAQYAALHTNYPTTTILNDEGVGMKVSYVADAKNYIDKKFTELAAAIVANA